MIKQIVRRFSSKIDTKINYYEVLGLKGDKVTDNEIKQSFYAMAKKYHPDSAETKDAEKFKQIVQAYEILGDKNKKSLYDDLRVQKSTVVNVNQEFRAQEQGWSYTYDSKGNKTKRQYYEQQPQNYQSQQQPAQQKPTQQDNSLLFFSFFSLFGIFCFAQTFDRNSAIQNNATALGRSQVVPFSGVYAPYMANTNPQAVYLKNKQLENPQAKKEQKEYFDQMALAKMNSPQNFGVRKQVDGEEVHGVDSQTGRYKQKYSIKTFNQKGGTKETTLTPEEKKQMKEKRLAKDRERTKLEKQILKEQSQTTQIKEKVQIRSPGGQTKIITITENTPMGKVKHVFRNSDDNIMNFTDNIPPRLIKKLREEKIDRKGKIEITIRPEDFKIMDPTKNDYAKKGPANPEWFKSKK